MSEITIVITAEKHKFLLKTLDALKNGVRVLGINHLYRQSLMKDLFTIETILKANAK